MNEIGKEEQRKQTGVPPQKKIFRVIQKGSTTEFTSAFPKTEQSLLWERKNYGLPPEATDEELAQAHEAELRKLEGRHK